jgi:hypothetical protein
MVFLDKSALDLMIQIMSLKVIVVDILKKKGLCDFFLSGYFNLIIKLAGLVGYLG